MKWKTFFSVFIIFFLGISAGVSGDSWVRPFTLSRLIIDSNLNLTGYNLTVDNIFVSGNITMEGSVLNVTTLNINVTGNVTANGTISSGDLLPLYTNGFNVGSEDLQWNDLFVAGDIHSHGAITKEAKAGEDLLKCRFVYTNDSSGNKPLVYYTDNQYHYSSHPFGMTVEDAVEGSTVHVASLGEVRVCDTSAFTNGTILHLGRNGTFQEALPPNGSQISIGSTTKVNAVSGIIDLEIEPYIHHVFGTTNNNVSIGGFGVGFYDYNNNLIGKMDMMNDYFTWNGSVGIGTNAPLANVHLSSNFNTAMYFTEVGNGATYGFGALGGYFKINSYGSLHGGSDLSFMRAGLNVEFNPSKADIDTIFYGDTAEIMRTDSTTDRLVFADDKYIALGTTNDVLFGYDSANTQALLDLTGVANTNFKIVTSGNPNLLTIDGGIGAISLGGTSLQAWDFIDASVTATDYYQFGMTMGVSSQAENYWATGLVGGVTRNSQANSSGDNVGLKGTVTMKPDVTGTTDSGDMIGADMNLQFSSNGFEPDNPSTFTKTGDSASLQTSTTIQFGNNVGNDVWTVDNLYDFKGNGITMTVDDSNDELTINNVKRFFVNDFCVSGATQCDDITVGNYTAFWIDAIDTNVKLTNTAMGLVLDGDGAGSDIILGDNQESRIYANADDLILEPTGNVGIGTTSPSHELNVIGSANITGSLIASALGSLSSFIDNIFAKNVTVQEKLILSNSSTNGIMVDINNPTYPWRDLLGEISTRGIGAQDPNDAVYIGGIRAYSFDVDDEFETDYHVPHDYVNGTDMFLHFHWSHNSLLVTGGSVNWSAEVTYAKGHNQMAFTTPTIINITCNASTTQYQHMICETQLSNSGGTGGLIDTNNLEPDGVLMMRGFLQSNDMTSSGAVPDPFLHYQDIHYQSFNIGTKDKAPNFYG